jgi:hypothetical protein
MKDTAAGIAVQYEWSDQDVIDVIVYASNGAFCGTSTVYIAHGTLSAMATELAGFPLDLNDKRAITLGSFGPKYVAA